MYKETELKNRIADKRTSSENQKSLIPKLQKSSFNVFSDYELATKRMAYYRWKSIENLDKLLIAFEANALKSGIKVICALDQEQMISELLAIVSKYQQPQVNLLSKYNLTVDALKPLIQQTDQPKAFINIEDALLLTADPVSIVCHPWSEAKLPSARIFIAPIDRIASSTNEIELQLSVVGFNKPNQSGPISYTLVSNGNDAYLNQDIYVLITDNGLSKLLEQHYERQLLRCIHCGNCATVCPVTQTIGDAAGNDSDNGPWHYLNTIVNGGQAEYGHYAGLCSLCGKCNQSCPAHIDLKSLFLNVRHENVQQKMRPQKERLFYMVWKKTMLKRDFMNWKTVNPMRYAVETVFLKSKQGLRKTGNVNAKSFNQQWRERMGLR
jgi:L-lactate utilization protein LutB